MPFRRNRKKSAAAQSGADAANEAAVAAPSPTSDEGRLRAEERRLGAEAERRTADVDTVQREASERLGGADEGRIGATTDVDEGSRAGAGEPEPGDATLLAELRAAEEGLARRREQEEALARELEATEERLAEG